MATATILAETAAPATRLARPAQVVRRPNGQVVVILFGRDALSEAAAWRSRGYRVDAISGVALGL
ncbi:MAG: hypothetical protein QOK39_766 [Acidimicrobiaceae bacterium]|jgi:anti-sigma factor ChrR (cupin superfamily)|nr:hypothetical protein [Acidimicrobiaceae bacterium]